MQNNIKIILHSGSESHVFIPIKIAEDFCHIEGNIIYFETKTERITSSLPFEVIYEK